MSDLKAVFFDQDGVIIDTERDGHRVAFNRVFEEFGFTDQWSVDAYRELLKVGGGKERMRHYMEQEGFHLRDDARLPDGLSLEDRDGLIKALHLRKTDLFIELIESGALCLRPGILRLMKEINDAGRVLGICTTSNERAAHAIADGALKDIRFDFILAGDVVSKKKPDPEIYNLALEKSGLTPEQCLVVEDSRNGLSAARAAGLKVLVTVNDYTRDEDFSEAAMVVSGLGDPDGERAEVLKGDENVVDQGVVTLESLRHLLSN